MAREGANVVLRAPGARSARITSRIGAAVVALMLLGCLASLPWTAGRVATEAAGQEPRRFERTDLDAALLPPFWSAHAADEQARVEAIVATRDATPRCWFGTDRLGRDLLVRCLAGGGISLSIGIAAALVAVLIGTTYGTVSGYLGGRVDAVMMRIVDILYGLPNILLCLLYTSPSPRD